MSLDKQNKIWHILHIIRDLEAGKTINIKEYATINNLSNRTVQRYFERGGQLYDLYSDKLIGHNGTFAIANENIVKDMLLAPTTSNELERIIDLYYMINPTIFERLDNETAGIIQKYYQKTKACYEVRQGLFENLKSDKVMQTLKSAIKDRKLCDVSYNPEYDKFEFKDVKLIKIIFFDGNWYVACLDESFELNNGFRWLRLNFIENISLKSQTFHRNPDAYDFIKNFQNMFSLYGAPKYKVELKVSPQKARFFKAKKFLKSQVVKKELDDGSIIVEYHITQDEEILSFIKSWIPFVEVISPDSLRDNLITSLSGYLSKFKLT